jgi:hypothetical protein
VSDPFGDPNAIILALSLPPGTYLMTATLTADVTATSSGNPSFSCFMWYGSPAAPSKIDQWANVFQIRNDNTQDSKKLAFHGPTTAFSSTTVVNLSCASPTGAFTGLRIIETEMTALPIGGTVQQ